MRRSFMTLVRANVELKDLDGVPVIQNYQDEFF